MRVSSRVVGHSSHSARAPQGSPAPGRWACAGALVRRQLLPAGAALVPALLHALRPGIRRPGDLPRFLLRLAFVPAFILAWLVQWLALVLDELLFPAYRATAVVQPAFIVGLPRCGTTLLHRTLAEDPASVTVSTLEALTACSLSLRAAGRGCAALDRLLGRLPSRLLRAGEQRLARRLAHSHPLDLEAPEEDFLALWPVLGCFLLVFPCAGDGRLWRLSAFDTELAPHERERLLDFYHLCLQKQLYAHGPERRLLSKNASFTSWAAQLRERFPGAATIYCLRDPLEAVPSQVSAVEDAMQAFVPSAQHEPMRERLVEMMRLNYERAAGALAGQAGEGPAPGPRRGAAHGGAVAGLTLPALQQDLAGEVRRLYRCCGWPLRAELPGRLAQAAAAAAAWRSTARYRAADAGGEAALRRRFAAYYAWAERRAARATRGDGTPSRKAAP